MDGFLDAVRGTFLGVRQPLLTAEEIRATKFATTRLRPGYDHQEVDAFLDQAAARLRIRCTECGAETAQATAVCARCGAPIVWPSAPATPPAAGRGDHVKTWPAGASDAWSPPAWIRRGRAYFVTALVFCLVVYMIGVVALNKTPQRTGLHATTGWVILFSLAGALQSLILLETARNQFRPRQVGWALVPIVSWGWLAFVPFLWLALIGRRAREWVVCAAYLAATGALAAFGISYALAGHYNQGGTAWTGAVVILAGLMVIAPAHVVVAFSPAAGVSSWRDAHAARVAAKRPQPVVDAVAPGQRLQDAEPDHLKPIATDLGGPNLN